MQPIIEVSNLSKKYNISRRKGGYVAMRDVLTNTLKNPISAAKYRIDAWSGKITQEDFWALKDINFQINRGEAIGVIGTNGSGKSTLLKILTKITPPTTGEVRLRGRVASLLEVGTGFHPELSGRENIFLNGAILGMTQKEIRSKFDDIVEFSGVEKFIDTPVKHYSSGMYVRLAFSVAAHLEPDILLVDEVLAVGDADFQKKCLGKMRDVIQSDGRTILFVSHNLDAISRLCERCILLDKGKIVIDGKTADVIDKYTNTLSKISSNTKFPVAPNKEIAVASVNLKNSKSSPSQEIHFREEFSLDIAVRAKKDIDAVLGIAISDTSGNIITTSHTVELYDDPSSPIQKIKKGSNTFKLTWNENIFRPGRYLISVSLFSRKLSTTYDFKENCVGFLIAPATLIDSTTFDERQKGLFFPSQVEWKRIS